MTNKILVTGFGPFDGLPTNPSQQLCLTLEESIHNCSVDKLILPVSFKSAGKNLIERLKSQDYRAVFLLGLAYPRSEVTLEKLAINWMDSEIGDNDGFLPEAKKIDANAPDAYFSSMDLRPLVEQPFPDTPPPKISYTAGTYVCNALYFNALHWIKKSGAPTQCLFIHVPPTPEIKGAAGSMELGSIRAQLEAIIGLAVKKDFPEPLS